MSGDPSEQGSETTQRSGSFLWRASWEHRKRLLRIEAWVLVVGAYVLVTFAYAWPADFRGQVATAVRTAQGAVPGGHGFMGHVGVSALVWVVLTVKAADIFAYLGGKTYGRHLLAPTISPKKTWEGAATGLAASVVVGLALKPFVGAAGAALSWPATLGFAVSLSVAGQLGDLVESRLKRRAQVKDSSTLLPEMGGALDLTDGLLVAAPVGYAWLRVAGGGI